jgi:hypothetical protein
MAIQTDRSATEGSCRHVAYGGSPAMARTVGFGAGRCKLLSFEMPGFRSRTSDRCFSSQRLRPGRMQFDRVVQWSRECFFASRRECHEVLAPSVGIVPGVALIAQCLSIIPVTSAPAMIGYGAGGFTTRDMMRPAARGNHVRSHAVTHVLLLASRGSLEMNEVCRIGEEGVGVGGMSLAMWRKSCPSK